MNHEPQYHEFDALRKYDHIHLKYEHLAKNLTGLEYDFQVHFCYDLRIEIVVHDVPPRLIAIYELFPKNQLETILWTRTCSMNIT